MANKNFYKHAYIIHALGVCYDSDTDETISWEFLYGKWIKSPTQWSMRTRALQQAEQDSPEVGRGNFWAGGRLSLEEGQEQWSKPPLPPNSPTGPA